MTPYIAGLTLSMIGDLLIALIVLKVHRDVLAEGKIGKRTKRDLRREMTLGVTGIIFFIVGYLLQLLGSR
ncbi:hypothetical protein COV06_00620 [Candidatus Uhrbacteria bacterium CG10_big_fil_rev_8_21_14_0_10_50_16]|uniref:Uncharacterized protein n=1 Tax=Candidatus Uhrbacteria bacterium CG10_big_fil_rev_8_21_14_0_10_50_16 TaxID=1975039 RepID=A0A2H0RN38_9BACT|nr:MAG: hypothetical protein COV06_00620 [Candidatus Uhrbacteria bacterium CG10_big_fil_rev_8_21_14_0_10_50_16]